MERDAVLWLWKETEMTYDLSTEAEDAIVATVRKGTPIKVAVTAAGVPWRKFVEWVQLGTADAPRPATVELTRWRHLNERITQAQAQHQAEMVSSIQEAATTPNLKTGLPDWRAADAMLSKHPLYRDDWREERRVHVEPTTPPGIPLEVWRAVQGLSDEELLALAGRLEDEEESLQEPPQGTARALPEPAVSPDQPKPRRPRRRQPSQDA